MKSASRLAAQIILLFAVVSLLGDVIYEGARSVNAAYLRTLGLNAALVGIITGLGEFLGYLLRLAAGFLADRTRLYWFFVFAGYGLLASVPLLSLSGVWQVAALLMILERVGKALRSPAKDTILSSAARHIGTGLGFGIHEALDQFGGFLGPLVITVALGVATGEGAESYRASYGWFWIPFVVLMLFLLFVFYRLPNPQSLEPPATEDPAPDRLGRIFWLYNLFSFTTTLGFVGWPLLSYHYVAAGILNGSQIALFYAIAMAIDGVAALVIGVVYDRFKQVKKTRHGGLMTLGIIPLLSLPIPLAGFAGPSPLMALAAAVLWGVVMGAQESVMRSAIADITSVSKRGTGYGIFHASYGLALFLAGSITGLLYEFGAPALLAFVALSQMVSAAMFVLMRRAVLRTSQVAS